ncbi:MAG: hypothetical protein JAY75_01065 [Candidatus Thiodiazotropha taylori]|nr:hypothetical protein [Candidatus Thiodiazotropha taylori]MCW4297076.1 hypothetical protein [Candidatus Thiodiazotropha endolucinida]MCG8115169.1 hypothetical protein [Candidatus Thiodiazotropha taylori]MCG8121383.1 hypothetical protein [Candidatus Thiodiazotropha taylori]MCW4299462.1 hypothetical protein [Candidatus Thiodiazotropha endolucinida]
MAKEEGWIPEGMQPPKAAWTKSKANTLYSKFPDPDPADCAAIVLNDWVRIHTMSMAVHKNADHTSNKTTLS